MRNKQLVMGWAVDYTCPGGDCGLTCCSKEWNIFITDEEIERYEKIDTEFGREICAAIDKEEKRMHCESGKCNLLDERGYCKIVYTLGEEYLSLVCQMFPRKIVELANYQVIGVEIACPLVAKELLNNNAFDIYEVDVDDDLFENKTGEQIELFAEYERQKEELKNMLLSESKSALNISSDRIQMLHRILLSCYESGILNIVLITVADRYPDIVKYIEEWLNDSNILQADIEEYCAFMRGNYPMMDEKYIEYFTFFNCATDDDAVWKQGIYTRVLELLIIHICAMAKWKGSHKLTVDDLAIIIASVDRKTNHAGDGINNKMYLLMDDYIGDNAPIDILAKITL